jgi:cytochrome c-type biogenesis protein CcmE
MTPARKRRLILVVGILAGVGIAGTLALTAFKKNVMFFYDPTQVASGQVQQGQRFRLGGMVEKGSVQRTPGSLEVRFVVTDFKSHLPVRYDKVLPDLFREGQGVVAHGKIGADGVFVADEVLAKHDEKYMPPEVARSLKAKGETYAPGSTQKRESAGNAPAPANDARSPPTTSTRAPVPTLTPAESTTSTQAAAPTSPPAAPMSTQAAALTSSQVAASQASAFTSAAMPASGS